VAGLLAVGLAYVAARDVLVGWGENRISLLLVLLGRSPPEGAEEDATPPVAPGEFLVRSEQPVTDRQSALRALVEATGWSLEETEWALDRPIVITDVDQESAERVRRIWEDAGGRARVEIDS
jgi:hypothetical protein